jgi:hypothetical protein
MRSLQKASSDPLPLLVAMEELPLLGGQPAAAQRLAKEIDDVALPPELAVADRIETNRFLLRHDFADRCILDRRERGSIDFTLAELTACFDQMRRPQQAANLIGAERRLERSGSHAISAPFCG